MGTDNKVVGVFVSRKINKVRWKPHELLDAEYFVAGSWDDEVNLLSLWKCSVDDDEGTNDYPNQKDCIEHDGDVTEIKFVTPNLFVASSSVGSVKLFNVSLKESATLREVKCWNKLHYFRSGRLASCTGLATFEEDVTTIGEDGRLVLLTAREAKPVRIFETADSSSIQCISFLKHNQVITGNLRGQMKIWDLKSHSEEPSSTFTLSGKPVRATYVVHHPTQRHTLLTGGGDGSLAVWDLRQHTYPVTLLNAHSDSVSEIQFHPETPDNLFTCSWSGQIWHWNASAVTRGQNMRQEPSYEENPWLSIEASKHRLEIYSLMPELDHPINGLDIYRNRVVCGCDNEAVYVFKDLVFQ